MDESYLDILRLVADRPFQLLPVAMHAVAVTLLNFHLIHPSVNDFTIDPEGIEAIVRSEPTPPYVHDLIERARSLGYWTA